MTHLEQAVAAIRVAQSVLTYGAVGIAQKELALALDHLANAAQDESVMP